MTSTPCRTEADPQAQPNLRRLTREGLTTLLTDALERDLPVSDLVERILELAREPPRSHAHSHPTRVAIITALAERGPSSPAALSAELGIAVTNLAYHFRALERFGAIELVEEIRRRGSIEHVFALCGDPDDASGHRT